MDEGKVKIMSARDEKNKGEELGVEFKSDAEKDCNSEFLQ